MDGFKDSTKTKYIKGYAKGGGVRGAAAVSKAMCDFKGGKPKPVKKALGGVVEPTNVQTMSATSAPVQTAAPTAAPASTGPVRTNGNANRADRQASRLAQKTAHDAEREQRRVSRDTTRPAGPRRGALQTVAGSVPAFTSDPLIGK